MARPSKRRASKRKPKAATPYGFRNPYVLKGLDYARKVVAGEIAACKFVRQACQRQLDDLERSEKDPSWPFRFDENLGGRAAEFFEQLPHIQGPLAYQRHDGSWNTFTLEPWQCFTETTLYGWVRKDSPPARPLRRFTRSYEEIPRSQGKSFKASGALLYAFTEGEQGVEAYSAAVDREQALKVYDVAAAMLRKRDDLRREMGLEITAHQIAQIETNSYAKALSREAKKTGDGKNIYIAVVDELHAHRTDEVWGVLDTGTGKRGGNALLRIITTSGKDTSGVCYKRRSYVVKVLSGEVVDDSWFGIIYTIDEEDDWTDEVCRAACDDHSHPKCVWRKANPNWGVSVDPIDFHAKMMRAVQVAGERTEMLTKHLNIWCSADLSWMDMKAWDLAGDPALERGQFLDDPACIGIDLAWRQDICAKAIMFRRDLPHREPAKAEAGEKEPHFYLFVDSYLPEEAVLGSGNSLYRGWREEGRIITSPTDPRVLSLEFFQGELELDCARFKVKAIPYDPAHATLLAQQMLAKGWPMVECRPLVMNFSEPMKALAALVLDGRLHHDANPCLRWMVSNVVCHRDAKDNIYPRKPSFEAKIDGVVAAIMALREAQAYVPQVTRSYVEGGELLVL